MPLDDAPRRYTRQVHLRLHTAHLTPKRLESARELALANPGMSRDEFIKSQPRIIGRRVVDEPRRALTPKKKRSLKKELLLIGGGAGGGAAIGALAGGGKGAAIGGITGGVAGLIYDLATRNK